MNAAVEVASSKSKLRVVAGDQLRAGQDFDLVTASAASALPGGGPVRTRPCERGRGRAPCAAERGVGGAVRERQRGPVRRFSARKGQRCLSGLWWSETAGAHVGFESWLLMRHHHTGPADGRVSWLLPKERRTHWLPRSRSQMGADNSQFIVEAARRRRATDHDQRSGVAGEGFQIVGLCRADASGITDEARRQRPDPSAEQARSRLDAAPLCRMRRCAHARLDATLGRARRPRDRAGNCAINSPMHSGSCGTTVSSAHINS